MLLSIKKLKKITPNWLWWSVLIAIALVILIFNDAFGDSEHFVIFSLVYFLLLTFLVCRWVFIQIKSIIRLKNEKKKTELLHLKSQVNPHFFFNTLNNLYGIMDKDSQAREMVLKLSEMMRYSIYEGQKDWVTLGKEIKFLENFINLHGIRYHKKTDVKFQHEIHNKETLITPLLFIILMENAYKHGLENMESNAFIHANLTSDENEICFEITNNFDKQEIKPEQGIGLKNLKRRLELVYPNKHKLSLGREEKVYTAKLTIRTK